MLGKYLEFAFYSACAKTYTMIEGEGKKAEIFQPVYVHTNLLGITNVIL